MSELNDDEASAENHYPADYSHQQHHQPQPPLHHHHQIQVAGEYNHQASGEYSNYPPPPNVIYYDYPANVPHGHSHANPNTNPNMHHAHNHNHSHNQNHNQGNHANIPAYDYFHPTPFNEIDPPQQHQQQQHNHHIEEQQQHQGHSVHQHQHQHQHQQHDPQQPQHHHVQVQHQNTQIHVGPHHPHQHQHQPQQHPPPQLNHNLHPHQMNVEIQQQPPHTLTANGEKKRVSANEAWNLKYQLLLQFQTMHGHVDVPQTYKDNKSLGKWVGKQREQFKVYFKNVHSPPDEVVSCAMTEERMRRLNEIGFKWSMGKGQYGKIHGIFDGSENMVKLWEEKFAKMELFKKIYGHVSVPYISSTGKFDAPPVLLNPETARDENEQKLSDDDIKSLSRWLKHQRQKFHDVQEGKVAAGQALEVRFRRLMDIGLDLRMLQSDDGRPTSSRDMTKVKEYRNHVWETRYKELCDYVEKHGHANVPAADKENPQLARWVGVQRDSYRLRKRQLEESQPMTNIHLAKIASKKPTVPVRINALTDERIELLQRVKFEFSFHDNRWGDKLNDLIAFKEKKGHVRVRHSDNKQLYEWLTRQRNLFRDYMQGNIMSGNTMNSERIAALERIDGFKWNYVFEPVSAQALKSTIERAEKGHDYKKKARNLKAGIAEKESENELIECVVNAINDAIDDQNEISANTEIPQEANIGDINIDTQHHHDNSLVGNKDEIIESYTNPISIPANLEPYSLHESQPLSTSTIQYLSMHKKGTKPQLWMQSYDKLVSFRKKHGHCRVPGRSKSDPKLGAWVKLQREDYKHLQEGKPSPMNNFRIDLLEKIEFDWTLVNMEERKNAWTFRYDQLKDFKDQYGHCDVPQQYAPNKALGKFVSQQREAYRDFCQQKPSILTKDKVQLLQEIGFRFKVGRGRATRTWDAYFDDLIKFKGKYGHTHIPLCYPSDPSFGKWCYQQRVNLEKRLSGKATNGKVKDRLEKLKNAGFSFFVKEKDTGRKRRSDFGLHRASKQKKTDGGGEQNTESGETLHVGVVENSVGRADLQEKEDNFDPVPIDEHDPSEIRDMDCLENVCDAFAL